MFENSFRGDPFVPVFLKHLHDKVLRLGRDVLPVLLRNFELAILVVIKHCGEVCAVKERLACKNCIKDHACAEDIALVVVAFVSEYLWGHIPRRAASVIQQVFGAVYLHTKAKVGYLQDSVVISRSEYQVLWLQISMHNVL